MMWLIVVFIVMSACSYGLGYFGAKIDSLKKFKAVMDEIHVRALNRDLSDEYQRGHAWGLIHAIEMIQESDVF